MLWTVVWVVLVLATLVGAFLLGRRLWRSAVALGAELSRASETLAALSERVEELEAAARAARDLSVRRWARTSRCWARACRSCATSGACGGRRAAHGTR
ncbi:hypothetical protein [Cellulomonas sp. JZ18]|uniref:hypothetical protein n=1 Tax=Cellulomonas sp. JZ18 TaxID=2654191 RepID=UPI0018AFD62E|nr:hypothetical protein [Cellulomonas sp. JZ18]